MNQYFQVILNRMLPSCLNILNKYFLGNECMVLTVSRLNHQPHNGVSSPVMKGLTMIYHNTSVLTNNYSFDKQASVHQMCEELFIFSLSHSFSSPYPLSLLSISCFMYHVSSPSLTLVLCIMSPLYFSLRLEDTYFSPQRFKPRRYIRQ